MATDLKESPDRVFALGFLNPKGGFYAEYAAVKAEMAAPVPANLTVEQAGVVGGVGITALRGLEDVLALQPGESVMIFGARVFAVASGDDGAALARQLGADVAVNGRQERRRRARKLALSLMYHLSDRFYAWTPGVFP